VAWRHQVSAFHVLLHLADHVPRTTMATRAGVAATVQVLLWLQVARAAGTPTPACPTRPDKMVVVIAVDASNASTPYYSWAKCTVQLHAWACQ